MGGHTRVLTIGGAATFAIAAAVPAAAQSSEQALRTELQAARAEIAAQRDQLQRQEQRLRALEERMTALAAAPVGSPTQVAAIPAGAASPSDPGAQQQAPVERVGQAPDDYDRPIEVAVLGEQGSAITRRGQLTLEGGVEFARADRNRAIFRGIELVESVLVGVFDINENRQNVLTASAAARYGLTSRLELGVRVPFVYRSDSSVLAPVQGSTANDPAATIDSSAKGSGVGDVELSARYLLRSARGGWPYLIANLQGVIPTGRGPFDVPRDSLGRQRKAATGAGFYGLSPSITAVLPSDPVILFGSLGYTYNFKKRVDTRIPPVIIDEVKPGSAISFSAGVGIAFNERTSINLGYAHNWSMGTRTRTRLIDPGVSDPGPVSRTSRDLQIGRLLFGVSHRVSERATINWAVEMGATDDATDLRTTLRIPFVLLRGS